MDKVLFGKKKNLKLLVMNIIIVYLFLIYSKIMNIVKNGFSE